jgi:beta-glucosidase
VPTGTKEQWPGVNGSSTYNEKLDVGYRWYDANHIEPLFPFGYGLSYTTFKLSDLVVTPKKIREIDSGKDVQVSLKVANTGKRAGAEIVQVYVEQPEQNGEPPRQLRAFAKVMLKAGQTRRVTLSLNKRSFSIYDAELHRWKVPSGNYGIMAGTSSRDLPLHDNVVVVDNQMHK